MQPAQPTTCCSAITHRIHTIDAEDKQMGAVAYSGRCARTFNLKNLATHNEHNKVPGVKARRLQCRQRSPTGLGCSARWWEMLPAFAFTLAALSRLLAKAGSQSHADRIIVGGNSSTSLDGSTCLLAPRTAVSHPRRLLCMRHHRRHRRVATLEKGSRVNRVL